MGVRWIDFRLSHANEESGPEQKSSGRGCFVVAHSGNRFCRT